MTTLGVVCLPQVPPERLRNAASVAEDVGLDELWLWEDCFWGGATPICATMLGCTVKLRVGIGLLPVPLRNVAATAMDAAMLCRLFPGRMMMGVGHGVQPWMIQIGAAVESPMTLLREYLTALRALLRGEKLTIEGHYVRLSEVALEWPPSTPLPVLAGAAGPRTLRLSGEAADGTILAAGTASGGVRRARELINEGRVIGGRADEHRLVVYLEVTSRDASSVTDAVASLAEAGADTVVLQPVETDGDPEEFIRFAGERVRPRL